MENLDRQQQIVRRSPRARQSANSSIAYSAAAKTETAKEGGNNQSNQDQSYSEEPIASSQQQQEQEEGRPSASSLNTPRRSIRRSSVEGGGKAEQSRSASVSTRVGAAKQSRSSDRPRNSLAEANAHPYTLRARASDQSEVSSSGTSQRAWSPLSTPATPATVHSVATSVSSSFLTNRTREDEQDESLIDVHQYASAATRVDRNGKRRARTLKAQPEATTTEHVPITSATTDNTATASAAAKGKKRAKSPASPEPSAKRSRNGEGSNASKAQSRYPLRSRIGKMAPSRKPTVSSASSKAAKSQTAAARTKAARAPVDPASTPSCSRSSDRMDVDEDADAIAGINVEDLDESFAHGDELVQAASTSEYDANNDDEMHLTHEGEDVGEEENALVSIPGDDEEPDEDNFDEDDEEAHYDVDDEDDDGADDPYGDDDDEGAGGFTSQLRAMAGYMSGLSGRFRTLLASIRNRRDPTAQLVALQELSEVLSISNEDTLAGYFPMDTFVTELIFLMGGPKPAKSSVSKSKVIEESQSDQDEEDALLAISAAFENNSEIMLLACRCLANLIEAMPYAANSVISHGALPVLNSKLVEIEFIDLAEQVLQTLEKISIEYPSAIVREGGLSIMLQYLDFFNIYVQRTAMNAAANCCRKLSADHFDKAKEVMPIIQNVLSYSDQRLVESACRCIVRLTDSFRHHGDLLEQLLTRDVVSAVNAILLPGSDPASNSTSVSPAMYTDLLKALGTAARVSPTIAVTLLESNIVETLYVLLTGSSTSKAGKRDDGALDASSGLGNAAIAVVSAEGLENVGMADVAILQNLAQRPKEQVQEALTLIAELLPPLPRDGIFNPRMYTERALAKRRARASRSQDSQTSSMKQQASPTPSQDVDSVASTTESPSKPERVKAERETVKERAQMRRIAALRERSDLVKRFTDLVLPTLVEVYAASVGYNVRSKSLYGILKLVNFVESAPLLQSLDNVPLASFIASVLSSRDHAILVQGALQLIEVLTTKLPDVYSALLRREGVMWEIEDIAKREPSGRAASKDAKDKSQGDSTPRADDENAKDVRRPAADPAASSSNLSRLLAATNALSGVSVISSTTIPTSSSSQIPSTLVTLSGHSISVVDAEDSNIWRARMLCDSLSPEASDASAGGADEAGRALGEIQKLVEVLQTKSETSTQDTLRNILDQIANLFCKDDSPISSFEMVRSGLIDGLHDFAIGDSDLLPTEIRRNLLTDAFMRDRGNDAKTALTALVRKLQETLSRLEDVEIMTTIYNEEDARRSPTANVARQVRLKLVGESDRDGQEIPRSCNNIVVSIHAITSFRSLHDYLRPKIAASLALSGSSMSSSMPRSISGLSGMLETLASSAGIEMSAALREHLRVAAGGGAGEASTQQLTATAETSSGAKDDGKKSALTTTNNDRRRSSRLSIKAGEGAESADAKAESSETAPSAQQGSSMGDGEIDAALARRLVEGMLEEDLDDLEGNEVFSDDYDDGFVMDEDHMDGLGGPGVGTAGDETISLEVMTDEKKSAGESDLDASKLSQSAPNTLPSHSLKATKDEGGSASGSSTGKGTYASALQKPPVDWHVQFEMDGQKVGLDSTIYSAIHRHEMRLRSQPDQAHLASRPSWTSSYTVKFRKVPGPEPKSAEDDMSANDEIDRLRTPDMADSDTPYTRILQLLRVFYNLNREWREQSSNDFGSGGSQPLNENAFVNNKLTAKLNRQLEEPMIVASKCLPSWALILPRRFPFLFPFEARFAFLQSTSFGYHRLISRWQMRQTRDQQAGGAASNARNDGSLALLGRLTRQKVRISRSNILASATKVFELYGANSSLLEVEYFDEVGTGLGPTLEFYAMVSKDFAKKSTNMWRVDESRDSEKNEYVSTANGLFPAPIDHLELDSSAGKSRVQLFRILGQFVAKAQFDSRIIDLNFSSLFMRAVLGLGIPCTLDMLRHVDEALARSLDKLRAMSTDELDELMLDFTMPGYAAYELHARGKDEAVTSANVEQYIDEVVTHTLQTGIRPFVEAFQKGFDLIFPISAMHAFTPEELVMLFGNQEEDWDEKTLMASIKPDHGYNADSPTFRNVISVMSTFTKTERRDFLQWLTGSPKLPVGGFMGLHPQLTIVKRPPDVNQSADQTLPSVMTCVNFCKMPPFSTRDVMRQRLLLAMREGQASFHLS